MPYQNLIKKHLVSWQYHEVYKGENLYKIAHNFHTKVRTLMYVNNLNSEFVMPGQGLLVPVYLNLRYKPIVRVGVLSQEATIGSITENKLVKGRIKTLSSNASAENLSTHPGDGVEINRPSSALIPHKKNKVHAHQLQRQPPVSASPVQKLIAWVFYNINLLH